MVSGNKISFTLFTLYAPCLLSSGEAKNEEREPIVAGDGMMVSSTSRLPLCTAFNKLMILHPRVLNAFRALGFGGR
jgi:hypothetical protein